MGALVKKDNKPIVETSFNRKTVHDLSRTILALKSASVKAVETLVKLMASDDPKIALEASKAVTTALAQMSDQKDRDEITRKIAAVKLQGVRPNENSYDNSPLVDFSTIQDVG
jgi:hypothetical protein